MSPIVFKVGGSLFDLPRLTAQLDQQLQRFPDQPRLLIAGGGAAADVVRNWDRQNQMSPHISHVLAVHSMSLSARFLVTLLPQAPLITSIAQASSLWAGRPGTTIVLDVAQDILAAEAAQQLPASWDVTSDAIAAWIAIRISAQRLVFLKSVDRPAAASWYEVAEAGHLDPFTPGLLAHAPTLAVDWVNLRSESPCPSPEGDTQRYATESSPQGTQRITETRRGNSS